jgi:subtilisin family serine protease
VIILFKTIKLTLYCIIIFILSFFFTTQTFALTPEETNYLIQQEQKILKQKENNIIVKYKNIVNPQQNIFSSNNIPSFIESKKEIIPNTEVITINSESNIDTIISQLKNDPNIESIEKDIIFTVNENIAYHYTVNDPYFEQQWYLDYIKVPWNIITNTSTNSNQITIAIIDTGIDITHEDLVNKIDINNGYNFISDNYDITDLHGHGTSISGIISAETNNNLGIAGITNTLNVKILPLKVGSAKGTIHLSDILEAINYAINQNVDIINMSFAASTYSEFLNQVIQNAINQEIIFIAGAGNNGQNYYQYPASYDNVISVGSISKNENISYFSNFNDKVDLVAPGEEIYTTIINNTYDYKKGTSYSTAIVTGIVAILKSINPSLTQQEIYEILTSTADDKGDIGKDNYYGYGIINSLEAINKITNNTKQNYQIWETKYDVSNFKTWTIKFSKLIDTNTVNNNNVYILDSNGNKLDQYISISNNKIVINPPINYYNFDSTYTLYIEDNIQSTDGQLLTQAVKMNFITEEWGITNITEKKE